MKKFRIIFIDKETKKTTRGLWCKAKEWNIWEIDYYIKRLERFFRNELEIGIQYR